MISSAELKLPVAVVGRSDVARLIRELEALDDASAAARAIEQDVQPAISFILTQLAKFNKINLFNVAERRQLKQILTAILAQAPDVHITFSAEPSPEAQARILGWLRKSTHPQALLTVGLQPAIAAGCLVRTPNHLFDFSLQNFLKSQSEYLMQLIHEATNG